MSGLDGRSPEEAPLAAPTNGAGGVERPRRSPPEEAPLAVPTNGAGVTTAQLPPEELIHLVPDVFTQPFWDAAAEHRLVIPRCTTCETYRLPPSAFCWHCRRCRTSTGWSTTAAAPSTRVHHRAPPDPPGPRRLGAVRPGRRRPAGHGRLSPRRSASRTSTSRTCASGWRSSWSRRDVRDGETVPTFRPATPSTRTEECDVPDLSGAKILVTGPTGQVAAPAHARPRRRGQRRMGGCPLPRRGGARASRGGWGHVRGRRPGDHRLHGFPQDFDYVLNLAVAKGGDDDWDRDLAAERGVDRPPDRAHAPVRVPALLVDRCLPASGSWSCARRDGSAR